MAKRYLSWMFCLTVVVGMGCGSRLLAQEATGAIRGTVLDPSGGAVPNANVVARNNATGVESKAASDASGLYHILYLPIGEYSVTVAALGFKTAEYVGLRVVAGNTIALDAHLALGQVPQTVQVSGAARIVDFTKITSGSTVSSETLTNLPIQISGTVRTATDFMKTVPGVTWNGLTGSIVMGMGDTGSNFNAIRYTIDGQMASLNFVQGLRDDSGIIPDMVQEFRLVANEDAQYGWTEGTGVELITKSGTNH